MWTSIGAPADLARASDACLGGREKTTSAHNGPELRSTMRQRRQTADRRNHPIHSRYVGCSWSGNICERSCIPRMGSAVATKAKTRYNTSSGIREIGVGSAEVRTKVAPRFSPVKLSVERRLLMVELEYRKQPWSLEVNCPWRHSFESDARTGRVGTRVIVASRRSHAALYERSVTLLSSPNIQLSVYSYWHHHL